MAGRVREAGEERARSGRGGEWRGKEGVGEERGWGRRGGGGGEGVGGRKRQNATEFLLFFVTQA